MAGQGDRKAVMYVSPDPPKSAHQWPSLSLAFSLLSPQWLQLEVDPETKMGGELGHLLGFA